MVLLILQRALWNPVTAMLLVCFCKTAIVQKLNTGCSFIFWAFAIALSATTVKMLMTSVTVKPKEEVASLWTPVEWIPKGCSLCLHCADGLYEESLGRQGGSGPYGRAGEEDRSHWMRHPFLTCPTAHRSAKATTVASLKPAWQIFAVLLSVVWCGTLHPNCLPQPCKCARILISHFSWSR